MVAVNSKHFIFVLKIGGGQISEYIANILVMSPKLDTLNEIMKIKVSLLVQGRYVVFYIVTFWGAFDSSS